MVRFPVILFILIMTSIQGVFACDQVIDPNKVMLFIDMNLSIKEVEAAKKGACTRGERFVLYPEGEKADKIRKHYYNFLSKQEYLDNGCKGVESPACEKLAKDVEKLDSQMNEFDLDEYTLDEEKLQGVLSSVKNSKASLSTLIVSGHDGGGEIDGDYIKGKFLKSDFFKIYDDVFDEKDKKDLHSILLWGCYTGTYSEATEWKAQFPSAKAVVGFYDSAPLATRPASSDLMLDFLEKESGLYAIADEKELKKSIQSLKSILYVQPGLLINSCHDEDIYYSHFMDGERRKTLYLTPKDADAVCETVQKEWNHDIKKIWDNYKEGYRDVPDKIAGTELRSLYGFIRQNEKCFKDHLNIDANQVGLMLFWYGVKDNFTRKYGDLMQNAQKELDELILKYEGFENEMDQLSEKIEKMRQEGRDRFGYFNGENSLKFEKRDMETVKDFDATYKAIYDVRSKDPDAALPEELQQTIESSSAYSRYAEKFKEIQQQEELVKIEHQIAPLGTRLKELQEKITWANGARTLKNIKDKKFPTAETSNYIRTKMVTDLRMMNNVFSTEVFQKEKVNYPHIEEAYKKIDHLLYQLDPSCMNFLEWHQYNPNKPLPKNNCEGK